MLNRIREQTGTAGLVLAVIALVLALVGGAYAASGGLTGKQKKEVTKIAKQYAGKPGEKGATGSTGSQGPKGDTGAQGTAGKEGKEGKEGPEGLQGLEGSPWTANGTLPPGATETGAWAFSRGEAENEPEGILVPLSFSIPFPYSLRKASVHFGKAGEGGAFSPGGACPTEPEEVGGVPLEGGAEAASGQLCIYSNEQSGIVGAEAPELVGTPHPSGVLLSFHATPGGITAAVGSGTFAITGCTEKVEGEGQRECE